MKPVVLCFSRSYLAHLLPELAKVGSTIQFLHVVQNERERAIVEQKGGRVVAVLASIFRQDLASANPPVWDEPQDFRSVTDFPWDPIQADRYIPRFKPALQKNIAGSIFNTFQKLFADHDVKAVLGEPVAIFPSQVMQYLIKKKGGASLLWSPAFFPGSFHFSDRITISKPKKHHAVQPDLSQSMMQTLHSYINGIATDKAGPSNHHKFAEKRVSAIDYFSQREGKSSRVYVGGLSAIAIQMARLARATAASLVFPRASDYMSAASVSEHLFYLKCLMKSRRSHDAPPADYAEKNIFYSMQFEPEASLLYFAPQVRNQLKLVENIVQAMPHGATLWVKEHPNQFGALALGEWRALRRRHSNLKYVYGRENGRELIKRCGLGVTITSTAGMDSLILGRKTLVFGDVFYRSLPGAIPVDGYADLAVELNRAENYGIFNFKDQIAEALQPYCESCYIGNPGPSTKLYTPENLTAIYLAIESEIKTLQTVPRDVIRDVTAAA